MLLRLLAPTAVLGVLVGVATPALADNHCREERIEDPVTGQVTIRMVCDPDESGETGDGARSGGGGSGITCEQGRWPPELVDEAVQSKNPFVVYNGTEDRGEDGIWGYAYFQCSDGSQRSWWVCYAACPSGAPAPDWEARLDALLAEATAKVDPPLPGIRHTFDQPAHDGTIRAVVLAETWWWTEETLEPITVYDEDAPVWVRITATPGALEIDPGDGSGTLTCKSQLAYNRNVSYYDQVPGEPKGACVHVYEQVFDEVTATMSVTWMLTYEGFAPGLGAVSGSLGSQTRLQTATFPVKEIQSVIVR